MQLVFVAFSFFLFHFKRMVAFVASAPTQRQLAILMGILMLHFCFIPHVGYLGECAGCGLADEYVSEHDGIVIGVSIVGPPADGFFLVFLLLHNSPI